MGHIVEQEVGDVQGRKLLKMQLQAVQEFVKLYNSGNMGMDRMSDRTLHSDYMERILELILFSPPIVEPSALLFR